MSSCKDPDGHIWNAYRECQWCGRKQVDEENESLQARSEAAEAERDRLREDEKRLRSALEAVAPTLSRGSKLDEIVQRALGLSCSE